MNGHIVMCGLSGFAVFFHIISQMAEFLGAGGVVEHKFFIYIYMYIFSLQLLSETFLILTRTERDTITSVNRFSCSVPGIVVTF